jgi:hypothetical protein
MSLTAQYESRPVRARTPWLVEGLRALTGGVFKNQIALSSWVGNLTSRFIKGSTPIVLFIERRRTDEERPSQ